MSSDWPLYVTVDNIMVSTNWCTHVIDYGNGCVLDDDNSDKYEDLYAVLHRIIYMIALSYPWKQYYTGLELFDHVEVNCHLSFKQN